MLQIIFSFLSLIPTLAFASATAGAQPLPALRLPFKNLFSHPAHMSSLKSAGISCTDCHRFSIKSSAVDPLAKKVSAGAMAVSKKVCHECHLGKVEVARVNQCSLCHQEPEKLKPLSHNLAWKTRHGSFAQMNPSSCTSCHQENQNACIQCHSQRNTLKPVVHRPNFRLTHSIEARANPAKCLTCHTTVTTCIQCHSGGISR